VKTIQPAAPRPPLRMLIADRDQRRCAPPSEVSDIAGYLDDVADELARRRIPVSTLEIDTRPPVTGRLVLGETGVVGPVTADPVGDRPTLSWRQDLGWSVGRHAALSRGRRAAPTAEPADVADFLQSSDAL
jgi:hypothetical protein